MTTNEEWQRRARINSWLAQQGFLSHHVRHGFSYFHNTVTRAPRAKSFLVTLGGKPIFAIALVKRQGWAKDQPLAYWLDAKARPGTLEILKNIHGVLLALPPGERRVLNVEYARPSEVVEKAAG